MPTLALIATISTARAGSTSFDGTPVRNREIKNWTQTFADWTLSCQEMVSVKRRTCSMRALLRDDRNAEIVVDVSTDDTGPTAALVHLPTGLAIGTGIAIRNGRSEARTLPIASCTAKTCEAIWSMTKADLGALDLGQTLVASYRTASIEDLPVFTAQLPSLPLSRFRISGNGFHEAIDAALH